MHSVSIALSTAGSISIERSLDGTSWSPVSEFSKSLAAAGSIEFGLSDIAIGQQLRFVSTVGNLNKSTSMNLSNFSLSAFSTSSRISTRTR